VHVGPLYTNLVTVCYIWSDKIRLIVYFKALKKQVNKRMARSINLLGSEYIQHQSNDDDSHLDGPIDNGTVPFNDAVKELI